MALRNYIQVPSSRRLESDYGGPPLARFFVLAAVCMPAMASCGKVRRDPIVRLMAVIKNEYLVELIRIASSSWLV